MKHKINEKYINDGFCNDPYCSGHHHYEYHCELCGNVTIDIPKSIDYIADKVLWVTLWHNVEMIEAVEYGRGVFGDPSVAGKTIR